MEHLEEFLKHIYAGYVCKPQKVLYGLKQEQKQWYSKINSYLCKDLYLEGSAYNPSFCAEKTNLELAITTVYVDGRAIAESSEQCFRN